MSSICEWLFFSDTHLGKLKKLFPENHIKICMEELRKPLTFAVKNGIKFVVNGGDLFDAPIIDHKYSRAIIKLFLEFPQLNIYVIAGNHDIEDVDNNSLHLLSLCCELGILPNVKIILEKTLIKLDGIPFNFMPYPHVRLSKKKVVNIAHMEMVGAKRDNGMLIKKGIEADNLDSLNFIGHIHLNQIIGKNSWFVGGLYQTNFGEQGPKGWFHVETKLGTRFKNKVKFIKNNCSFELVNLRIDVEEGFKQIEKSDLKLYKLQLADGLTVPPKLTMKFPNIVNVVGFRGGEELALFAKELPAEMYEGTDILEDLTNDPLWGLLEFLKSEGLKKVNASGL